jgi:hypothetical protein
MKTLAIYKVFMHEIGELGYSRKLIYLTAAPILASNPCFHPLLARLGKFLLRWCFKASPPNPGSHLRHDARQSVTSIVQQAPLGPRIATLIHVASSRAVRRVADEINQI